MTFFAAIIDKLFSIPIIGRYQKLIKYIISGGTATVVDLAFLYFFTSILHIWYLISAILAFLIAFVVSFVLQKFWTFTDRSERWKSQAMLYFVITSTNLGLNTLLMYLFVDFIYIHYIVAQMIASALIAFESYFAYQIFVFKNEKLIGGVKTHVNKKYAVFVVALLVIFLLIRLPGVSLPYHQDEWKNVASSASVIDAGKFFAHPPLMQILLVIGYKIFGESKYRLYPLFFSLASFVLLYFVLKKRASKKVAIWSLFIFTFLFYNILGSLVPDVDGSILPLLFLLSVFFYDKWNATTGNGKWKWFILMFLVLLIGFLTKLSFIIAVGAIILDYAWVNRKEITIRKLGYGIFSVGCFAAIYVALIYFIHYIYPAFDIKIMLGHANQFSESMGRNWIQIVVQGIKAIFYLSPLALVPLLFSSREIFKKIRIFWLYLVLGLIFYFLVFDFSRGALDKYLMFAIVPLSVIVGSIFAHIFEGEHGIRWRAQMIEPIFIGIVVSAMLFVLNFLPNEVLPLYPKTLWFTRILHGKWFILNPFNGGSGPLGFYVSFLFIAASFILSLVCIAFGFWRKEWRSCAAIVLILIGLSYNAVFAEELFFGKINGSAPQVLAKSVEFIRSRPDITKVITYNDIGAGPLEKMGKYGGRIYATPESEDRYKEIFAKHMATGGHFMVVGIPPLGEASFYGKFFAGCDSLFETASRRIRADVYKCSVNQINKAKK